MLMKTFLAFEWQIAVTYPFKSKNTILRLQHTGYANIYHMGQIQEKPPQQLYENNVRKFSGFWLFSFRQNLDILTKDSEEQIVKFTDHNWGKFSVARKFLSRDVTKISKITWFWEHLP